MPHQDVPDGVVIHGVVQRQRDAAWIAKDYVHVFVYQAFKQDAGPAQEGNNLLD